MEVLRTADFVPLQLRQEDCGADMACIEQLCSVDGLSVPTDRRLASVVSSLQYFVGVPTLSNVCRFGTGEGRPGRDLVCQRAVSR
jgi:hypothetical protein